MDVQTSWEELYLSALIESNKEKLTGLVQTIERERLPAALKSF